MKSWVQPWAILWVICLVTHTYGQLGVRMDEEEESHPSIHPPISDHVHPDSKMESEEMEGEEGEPEDRIKEPREKYPWLWVRAGGGRRKPVKDTYQGCFNHTTFNGTLMYVNLTEVIEVNDDIESKEEACFHMCNQKDPLSLYIAFSASISSSWADGCGCQDQLDQSKKIADEGCDEDMHYYQTYCGPNNVKCINNSNRVIISSFLLFFLPLLSHLHSLVTRELMCS